MSTKTIAKRLEQLATASRSWATLSPSPGAILEMQTHLDSVARQLATVSDGQELAAHPVRTSGELCQQAHSAARGLFTITRGWPARTPCRFTLADAERLNTLIRLSIIGLQSFQKAASDDDQ